jgi:hypothetical protein
MKLSLIYENRPQGPPTGPLKKWYFWPNSDLEKIWRPERKILMIRDGQDPVASSSTFPNVAPLPPVQRTGERNSPPRILESWRCPSVHCQGWWGETDQEGDNWMREKENYVRRVPYHRAFLTHECEICTGVYWDGGHQKRFAHTGVFFIVNTPWIFRGCEPIRRNGLPCEYPPSGEQPIHPWSEGSDENINSTPARIPEEKKNVRVIFMDKQIGTPLSSTSNSPHSKSTCTTL